MTIKGRTAAEIAAILGVAETTVITHRKKAYKRMNVTSMRELLARM
jgi:DNA-binding CsgD family transcriptional regulator